MFIDIIYKDISWNITVVSLMYIDFNLQIELAEYTVTS